MGGAEVGWGFSVASLDLVHLTNKASLEGTDAATGGKKEKYKEEKLGHKAAAIVEVPPTLDIIT